MLISLTNSMKTTRGSNFDRDPRGSPRPVRGFRTTRRVVCVAQPAGSRGAPQVFSATGSSKLKALITPFNDPQANRKMLSLATAQMLCSVATLIHDTYLPVYMSDVLGMSNSKIGNLQAIALFLSKVRHLIPWPATSCRRCRSHPATCLLTRRSYRVSSRLLAR